MRVSNLDTRDHVDFLMALGEALFFEDDYGAAATLFESGIDGAIAQGTETGEAMLEWWGSAVERHADALERDGAHHRVRAAARSDGARAVAQSRHRPPPRIGSSSARAAAATPIEAWDAAIAGWVRARLAGARSATLRADLDKLVLEGIIPDRVRSLAADRRAQAESDLRAEWAVVKERWK